MTDDLVGRLQRWCQNTGFDGNPNSPPMLALARIEALEGENRKLREALVKIAADRFGVPHGHLWEVSLERRDIARAALAKDQSHAD